MPKVTVLLPVWNAEKYIGEAIQSILTQTFTDFELLIIDDGSTDSSLSEIAKFQDSRIRLEKNPVNLGLIATLNRGMEIANGELIARMDADDISLPARLAKQVGFMMDNPEVVICGTGIELFGDKEGVIRHHPADPGMAHATLLFNSTLYHPTVMFRKEFFLSNNLLYNPEFPNAEDYELWTRVAALGKIANITEVLLKYRVHAQSITKSRKDAHLSTVLKIRTHLFNQLSLELSEEERGIFQSIVEYKFTRGRAALELTDELFQNILKANEKMRIYPHSALSVLLSNKFALALKHSGLRRRERLLRALVAKSLRLPDRIKLVTLTFRNAL